LSSWHGDRSCNTLAWLESIITLLNMLVRDAPGVCLLSNALPAFQWRLVGTGTAPRPWSRVLLEKLTVAQLVNKLFTF
jgi:hypothetical protein